MIVSLIKSYETTLEEDLEFADSCKKSDVHWYSRIIDKFKPEHDDDELPKPSRNCGANSQSDINVTTLALMSDFQNDKLQEVAKTLDISVEGVSLKGLFSAFGNLVAPPKTELIASIYESNNTKRTYVAVAGDSTSRTMRELTAVAPAVSPLDTPGQDGDSAFRIACYLIWIQLNKDSEQFEQPRVSFDEFCDWAKILGIRKTLETTDAYRLEDRKKSLDIDFIKRRMALAVRREIGFRNTYVSLADFGNFISKETIKLDDEKEATIDDVADLVRYFAVTGVTADQDDKNAWLTSVVTPVNSQRDIFRAYFGRFTSTDCKPDDRLPGALIHAKSNIVQITSVMANARKVVSTGLIIEDDHVLTYYSDRRGYALLADRFKNATVSSAECLNTGDPVLVTSATPAVPNGKAPYAILTVPGLRRQAPNPERKFEGPETEGDGTSIFIAGIVPDSQAILASFLAPLAGAELPPNNGAIYYVSGRAFSDFSRNPFGDDGERRFVLSAPFSRGLVGSPIVDEFGRLVGFVGFGTSVGGGVLLSVGSAMTTLKDLPSLKNKKGAEEGDR